MPEEQGEFGQIARSVKKNPVFAQSERLNVAVTVEYREARAIFQNADSIVGRR